MALIVQKYGGTSVGDLERIRNVASRVKKNHEAGNEIVVVVSARSGVTNRLVADARSLHPNPNEREMDMLLAVGEQETIALMAIALHRLGVPAVSRTGGQAGIKTDFAHTRARIVKVTAGDIREQLSEGNVVIVAGFQGINQHNQITTFGRGGSDLSAIALASSLNADQCQICTDVDGVFTADPRIVSTARKISQISYDEMLELASLGSKVMQSRAVEFAKKFDVEFEVCSSFNNKPGTIVKKEAASMEEVVVRGAAVDKDQVKIVVSQVHDQPGTAAKVFQALADAEVNVDMIVQNIGHGGIANLTFSAPLEDAFRAEKAVGEILDLMGGGKVEGVDRIAKLSVVGVGMRTHSGVAAKLFTALAEAGINIQLISTSEIKISVAIDVDKADAALRLVHEAFELEKEETVL